MTKYRQLAFEMRERRPGYEIVIFPVVIGALGGGMKQARVLMSRNSSQKRKKSKKLFAKCKKIDGQ